MSTFDVPINLETIFEPLLDSRQAALLVHLHHKTLERMARTGLVPATKQGKCWLFRASKLNTWVNQAFDCNTTNCSGVDRGDRKTIRTGTESEASG